jgi:M6 family metalloprotease-like protein
MRSSPGTPAPSGPARMRRSTPVRTLSSRVLRLGMVLAVLLALWQQPAETAPLGLTLTYEPLPGTAADVGVGPNGEIWIVEAPKKVLRLEGGAWTDTKLPAFGPNDASRVAVSPNGVAWAVTSRGSVFKFEENRWKLAHFNTRDISIGGNGDVWLVNMDNTIAQFRNEFAEPVDGPKANRIAVAPDGTPWIAASDITIHRRRGGAWEQLPGLATDIAIGLDGSVWVVGAQGGSFKWMGNDWEQADAVAKEIAVQANGLPVVVTNTGTIQRATAANGQTQVAVAPPAPPTPLPGPTAIPVPARQADAPDAVTWTTANILCTFADSEETPGSKESVQEMFMGEGGLDQMVRESSYGKANLNGTRTFGWYTLPGPLAQYKSADPSQFWAADARPLADACMGAAANDVDFNEFQVVSLFFNAQLNVSGGYQAAEYTLSGTTRRWHVFWLNNRAWNSPALWAHEFGHLVGGTHSDNRYDSLGTTPFGQRKGGAITNPSRAGVAAYNAYTREQAGWLPADRKVTYAGQPQQVTLARLTHPGTDGALMVQIPIGDGASFYTVEFRTRIGIDASMDFPTFTINQRLLLPADAVVIQRMQPGADPALRLVKPGAEEGGWTAGTTFNDPENNFSLRVDAMDGSTARITIGSAQASLASSPGLLANAAGGETHDHAHD